MADRRIAVTRSGGYIEALDDLLGETGVDSAFGRTGTVVATSGDYTAAQVTNAADKSAAGTQLFTAVIDGAGLGGTISYVSVTNAAPVGGYAGYPFVLNNTTTTGGLYAWTGHSYVQIAESPFSLV